MLKWLARPSMENSLISFLPLYISINVPNKTNFSYYKIWSGDMGSMAHCNSYCLLLTLLLTGQIDLGHLNIINVSHISHI